MANWTQEAVDRLAKAVSERRAYIGRSQIEVWENGGPSNSTMTSIESAASLTITPSTLKKLDAGLAWIAGTAGGLLRGDVPHGRAVRDLTFDNRRVSEIEETEIMRQEQQARNEARDQRTRAEVATALDNFTALIAALSVDADDIQTTARGIDTSIDVNDPDAVEWLIGEVDDVVRDVDEFVGAVDEVARKVFGGDIERLRRAKRETKRLRRQQTAEHATRTGITGLLSAARTAPVGHKKGQSEQGEAGGEENQDA
jgi:hypothetical protein